MGALPLRVIVVEDDEVLRDALVEWLEASGVAVVAEAGSACEAIRAIGDHEADTVLLDFRLQRSSGLEVSHAVRAAGNSALRIVMFSAFSDASLRASALEAGVDAFIRKGADPAALLAALHGPTEAMTDAKAEVYAQVEAATQRIGASR